MVSEQPASVEERSFWVVPTSRPSSTAAQVIVLSGALLSKGGDYQLNEERTFAIDTTPGQSHAASSGRRLLLKSFSHLN